VRTSRHARQTIEDLADSDGEMFNQSPTTRATVCLNGLHFGEARGPPSRKGSRLRTPPGGGGGEQSPGPPGPFQPSAHRFLARNRQSVRPSIHLNGVSPEL
jgi:hypothetical protein